MALSLGLRKNDMVKVAKSYIKVIDIKGASSFVVGVCNEKGKLQGSPLTITDKKTVEVLNGVKVTAGLGNESLARIAIIAPKSVAISRIHSLFVTKEALEQWDVLFPKKNIGDLRKLLNTAKQVPGLVDWRENDGLFFKLQGNSVVVVTNVTPYEGSCNICHGAGYTLMYDDFEKRHVEIPCHECNK